jgi:hypothetical protein
MIASVVAYISMALAIAPSQAELVPPIGTSSRFLERLESLQDLLAAKKYSNATDYAKFFPKPVNTFRVDPKNVPKEYQEEFIQSVRFAFEKWNFALSGYSKFSEKKTGRVDLLVGFQPTVAKTTQGEIRSYVEFWGESGLEPSLEAIFALKYGSTSRTTIDFYNDTLYAVGSYLGLTALKQPESAMERTEASSGSMHEISEFEKNNAKRLISISRILRETATKKKPFIARKARLFLESKTLQFPDTLQGEFGETEFLISNNGNSTLQLLAFGDCGCIKGFAPPELKPGETARLNGTYDTTEITGEVRHNVVLLTNDPRYTRIKIPTIIKVKPRFAAVFPDSDVVDLNQPKNEMSFYFTSDLEKLPEIKQVNTGGFPLKVSYEKFYGTVDNKFGKASKEKIRGYKVTVDYSGVRTIPIYGRINSSIFFATNDEVLSSVRPMLNFQKGILAIPETLFLGSPTGPFEAKLLISRPANDFKIVEIRSESQRLTASVKKRLSAGEYELKIRYDGKALDHKINSKLYIKTDDPNAPEIVVPVLSSGI